MPARRHVDRIEARCCALPFGAALQLARPGEIRAMSLQIFDRSFAVTYLLEAIAIVIGLSGVAATFSAQTLARAREFGMLRHVGVTRGQVLGILASKAALLTVLGVACGFALGLVISLILVFVVNPQSFHWTMQLHLPWPLLGTWRRCWWRPRSARRWCRDATRCRAGRCAPSGRTGDAPACAFLLLLLLFIGAVRRPRRRLRAGDAGPRAGFPPTSAPIPTFAPSGGTSPAG
jgi:hypothetical protein